MADLGPVSVKTVVAGAVGYGISRWVLGDSPSYYGNFLGYATSAPMATGLACAAGTLLQSTVGGSITPSAIPSAVAGPAVAGALTTGATYLSGSSNPVMSFAVGGVSNYAADMVGRKVCTDNRCNWNSV